MPIYRPLLQIRGSTLPPNPRSIHRCRRMYSERAEQRLLPPAPTRTLPRGRRHPPLPRPARPTGSPPQAGSGPSRPAPRASSVPTPGGRRRRAPLPASPHRSVTAAPPLAAFAAKLDAGSPAPRDATPRLREAPGDRLLVAGGLSGERSGRRGSFFSGDPRAATVPRPCLGLRATETLDPEVEFSSKSRRFPNPCAPIHSLISLHL